MWPPLLLYPGDGPVDKLYTQSDKFEKVHIATWHAHGEEAIQPDSLETICPSRWLTRLFQ